MQTAEMRMQTVQPKTQFHAASILVPICTCFSAVVLVVAFNVMASTSCFFFCQTLVVKMLHEHQMFRLPESIHNHKCPSLHKHPRSQDVI